VDGSEPDFDYCPADQKPVITFQDLLLENVIPTCSTVFRRGLVGERPEWLLRLRMGDYPLHLLNAQRGNAGYLPQTMGVYRVHRGGTWRQMNWVAQVQANVAMFEQLVGHVEPQFRSGVKAALAKRYWQLTVGYEEMGDPKLARRYALKSFRTKLWTSSPKQLHRLKRLTRLSAPVVHRTAQRLFPRMRSSSTPRGDKHRADAPALSVVIPAFNAERYLEQAVASVLAQTFSSFECILVDDGSTDRTARILADLANRDERVRPLRIEHSGIVAALNAGLKASRAPLVARMDADDLCTPERFEKQVEYLREHPECLALGTRVMLVDPYGSPLWEIDIRTEHDAIEDELLRANGWAIFHPSIMMRRDPVLDLGGYRQEYQWSEDIDLFLRIAEIGRLANLPQTLLHYRQHLASVNRMKTQEQVRTNQRLLAEAFRRRGRQWPPDLTVQPPPLLNRYDQFHAWGRRALINRNYRVARHHALAAVRERPFQRASWSLMYHAAIGK
jgi:glycosyltransferase involved in cell wall biosynthesis